MSNVRTDELVELSSKYQFWLKPVCRLNITVQLPQLSSGKAAISTTAVIDRINKRAKVQFKSLKVTKITIDFLRLEGELESLKQLEIVQQRLDKVKIKLDGFDEQLKLKASQVKIGPFKHDWETFFRDNPHMDELKPGYRPDTVLVQNLPLRWFSKDENLKTNWLIGAFSTFGDIRRFHIPLLDEIEKAKASKNDESEGFKKFNFNSEHQTFDCYLMYKDYVGFLNAMDGLRGMKLVKCRKDENSKTEYVEHEIKLDFDRSKHLSDKAIRRRQIAKKYGINTLDDLNEYKKKAKERKALFEERMRQLKRHKKSSRNLLDFLARLIAVEEAKREQEELKALNERLLKERLIEEEKKLRNKLIERQRSLMMEKLKEQEKLDTQESNDSPSDGRRSPYDLSHSREHSGRPFGHSRPDRAPNRYDEHAGRPDSIFRNPRINPKFGSHGNQTNHFDSFDVHSASFHAEPQRPSNAHRSASPGHFGQPHHHPYQTNNRNTFAYNKKSNYYDDYRERADYPERSYPERNDYRRHDYRPERTIRSDYQRPGERFDRSDRFDPGYRSNSERAGGYPSDYRERSNSYASRPGQSERDDYLRDNYQERGGYRAAGYPERPDYRDRPPYERPYDRSYDRPNSFHRSANRAHEEDSRSEEKSSRPKSLVVLPQK